MESLQENLQDKPVGCEETFQQLFLIFKSSHSQYQSFLAASGTLGRKVPAVDIILLSHEQEIYRSTTSLDEVCILFEFRTGRNYYVDFMTEKHVLGLKLKFVKGGGYEK